MKNKIMKAVRIEVLVVLILMFLTIDVFSQSQIKSKEPWKDSTGDIINAHGGGVVFFKEKYYWFGEKRGGHASQGVNVYSSKDLVNWEMEGLALKPDTGASDISYGCVMERPKVLYNEATGKFVMWFHLELKGQGYNAARAAVAVSDHITGPYHFVSSFRPNGNMSRDMTLFKDDNGSAYTIYSSRENYDLRVAKLSADYLSVTSEDHLISSDHREAPAIFKRDGIYYLITSGCTGWAPNEANLYTSNSIFGPWSRKGDPIIGERSENTFGGQSTYILSVEGKKDAFIFMADVWQPNDLKTSSYVWLPIHFHSGFPQIKWDDSWSLKQF